LGREKQIKNNFKEKLFGVRRKYNILKVELNLIILWMFIIIGGIKFWNDLKNEI